VHTDHYHTTVQPIAHQEVLPEQHVSQVAPQIEREYRHGNEEQERARAEAQLQEFRDTRAVEQTTQSMEAAPTVAGEHVHHHGEYCVRRS